MSSRHQIDNAGFVGRSAEREAFRTLLQRSSASLVTCQGRRRIGKSRFIAECARQAGRFIAFSGLAPREGLSKSDQLAAFAQQLAEQTAMPRVALDGWPTAFALLASQLPASGSVVVLFDEISWMSVGDRDFAGHLKTAWDTLFSKRRGLILVLCGSVSSWVEQNILNNTGFVGRCAWHFNLQPLPLRDCARFWGKRAGRVSAAEKWRMLSVTGGVPGYLEQLLATRSAEENIERLCFNPGGMLFHECARIFHDLFTRRAGTYRDIAATLAGGPKTLTQIGEALGRGRGGSLGDALHELTLAGFLRNDVFFDPVTGRRRPKEHRYRIADPYLRFHLKYISPNEERISQGLYQRAPLETLEAWDTVMGLQFETLLLDSRDELFDALGLKNRAILNAGPYAQSKTQRREACQVDLLVRTRESLYVVEFKHRRAISQNVVAEVQQKVARLKLPRGRSCRTALVYSGALDPGIEASGYFDFLVNADEWLM